MRYLKIALITSIGIAIVFSNAYALNGITPPLEQLKSGVLVQDIKCKESFVLVIKESSEQPACVKPTTATRLLIHGWIMPDKVGTSFHSLDKSNIKIPTMHKNTTNSTRVSDSTFSSLSGSSSRNGKSF